LFSRRNERYFPEQKHEIIDRLLEYTEVDGFEKSAETGAALLAGRLREVKAHLNFQNAVPTTIMLAMMLSFDRTFYVGSLMENSLLALVADKIPEISSFSMLIFRNSHENPVLSSVPLPKSRFDQFLIKIHKTHGTDVKILPKAYIIDIFKPKVDQKIHIYDTFGKIESENSITTQDNTPFSVRTYSRSINLLKNKKLASGFTGFKSVQKYTSSSLQLSDFQPEYDDNGHIITQGSRLLVTRYIKRQFELVKVLKKRFPALADWKNFGWFLLGGTWNHQRHLLSVPNFAPENRGVQIEAVAMASRESIFRGEGKNSI